MLMRDLSLFRMMLLWVSTKHKITKKLNLSEKMFFFFPFETEHKEPEQLLKNMAKQTMQNLTFGEVLVSFT